MAMTKAYDFAYLAKQLKKPLLAGVEATVDASYLEIKAWLKESSTLTASPIDDLAVAGLDAIDKVVEDTIDKIDGE